MSVNRERARRRKQYRSARDFVEFMTQLRHDLPGIEVLLKNCFWGYRCIESTERLKGFPAPRFGP